MNLENIIRAFAGESGIALLPVYRADAAPLDAPVPVEDASGYWVDLLDSQGRVLASAGLCVLGVVARLAAMLLSLLCGLWLIPAMPEGFAAITLAAALSLVLTGAGDVRLWQPEDRILMSNRSEGTAH
mgnify:CR=1 FL=1